MFSNLLNSAAKFTDPGGRVCLSLRREGAEAVATVRDSGCGIGADVLGGIFDMFSQGPSHQRKGGLGIGLGLVRQLVQLHGGRIQAESKGAGTGSTFTVRLPVAIAGSGAESKTEFADECGQRPLGQRILTVDDNSDAADSLATALELEGHLVEVADNGQTALAKYQRSAPDVVLLDLGMPDLDGYELAMRLRMLDLGKSVRLFALTGFGSERDKTRVREAGFDGHFTKPAAPEALRRVI